MVKIMSLHVKDLMANDISFTIIIPTYNTEKYIPNCIESILNQEYDNYEIIIVDDCSTDKTLEIIKQYESDNIRIFSAPKNSGPGIARNIGIEHAKNEYILFCDSDDYYLENAFEKICKKIEETNSDIVIFNGEYKDHSSFLGNGYREKLKTWSYEDDITIDGIKILYEAKDIYICGSCYIAIKNKFIKKYDIKFKNYFIMEDILFCINCFLNHPKVSFVIDNVYCRVFRNHSITSSIMSKKKIYCFYNYLQDVMQLNEKNNHIFDNYIKNYINQIQYAIKEYYDQKYRNKVLIKFKKIGEEYELERGRME